MPLDTKGNFWTLRGEDGQSRQHVPPQPMWTFFLRIAQFVVAIIVIGLTGYAADTFGTTDNLDGLSFSFFLFAWTLLFLGWLLISTFFFPIAYNYWAHAAVEGVTVIFWLAGWAVLADNASDLAKAEKYLGGYSGYSDYLPSDVKDQISDTKTAIDCVKAAAGLGALEWVLFIVTLVFFVLSLLSHRKTEAGVAAHEKPAPGTEMGTQQPQTYPQQPQQPYPQQTYEQQQPQVYQQPQQSYPQQPTPYQQ